MAALRLSDAYTCAARVLGIAAALDIPLDWAGGMRLEVVWISHAS